jgi:hypothetical protein
MWRWMKKTVYLKEDFLKNKEGSLEFSINNIDNQLNATIMVY